jgi:hypothetical protein
MHHVVLHIIHGIVPSLISSLFHFDKNDNLISILTWVIKFCYKWHAPSRQLASPLEVELPAISLLHIPVSDTPFLESLGCLRSYGECSAK